MTDNESTIRPTEGWSVEKKIPVSLLLALICQTAVGAWYASGMAHDTADNTRRIAIMETWATSVNGAGGVNDRLTRVEEKISDVKETLNRMETVRQTADTAAAVTNNSSSNRR